MKIAKRQKTLFARCYISNFSNHNRSQYLHLNLAEGTFLVGLIFCYIRQEFLTPRT